MQEVREVSFNFSSDRLWHVVRVGDLPPNKYYETAPTCLFIIGNPIGRVDSQGFVTLYVFCNQASMGVLKGRSSVSGSESVIFSLCEKVQVGFNTTNLDSPLLVEKTPGGKTINVPLKRLNIEIVICLQERLLQKGLIYVGRKMLGGGYVGVIYNYGEPVELKEIDFMEMVPIE